ncbi:pyridoxamine 5'-phosphate oxidase family protein [Mariluticola halotolerans]|uniref:pyridoxamine 5'-phosphate oxidase family protein n=1 Tax=Mariluticola halotolerans TaxID=2909283 RepID=UPI0026E305E8|nr:pyridoxamine 5'-phosphate oxidase family protein [Mariluticola halotolerans]UJQ95247.1 pyridoxamine 5'-phosphate oxidase family protein [Mariluticola halotolerans]
MTTLDDFKENPLKQFWDKLEDIRTVMLGSPASDQHMQPMTANGAREENAVWFYSKKDTDLAKAAQSGGEVHMCLTDRDHGYYACVMGHLVLEHSELHIKRYWNPVASAWYPDGKADPDLTMLKLIPRTAAIWAGSGNPVKFGWEVARANISGSEPDVGHHTTVTFPQSGGR